MNAYLDTSVVLRVLLGEPGRLRSWSRITRAFSSELLRVEALRTLDRGRAEGRVNELQVAELRAGLYELTDALELASVSRAVLRRAEDSFPLPLGTLDGLHLATAVLLKRRVADLRFATHDAGLALAARALGFAVLEA